MTNSKFFFIRHGQLVAPYMDYSAMDYKTLTDLSVGTLDPGINKNASELFVKQTKDLDLSSISVVYYNNSGISSQRSLESAKCIVARLQKMYGTSPLLKGIPEIREVRFDVSGLLLVDEFKLNGMSAVRSALYKASIYGGAAEPVAEINQRIQAVEKVILEHAKSNESVLFSTHDFFMRFLELYVTREARLHGITEVDLNSTLLNSFFCGFITNQELRMLSRWGSAVR